MQSQVRFNRVPEKVWEALVRSQVRPNRVPENVPEKVWESLVQSQVRFNRICGHLTHGNPAELFPAWLRTLERGMPPKLYFIFYSVKILRNQLYII